MIKIRNIYKKDNIVTMIVIPAGDNNQAFNLFFDVDKKVIIGDVKEEQMYYASRACDKILVLLRESETLPQEASSYWY